MSRQHADALQLTPRLTFRWRQAPKGKSRQSHQDAPTRRSTAFAWRRAVNKPACGTAVHRHRQVAGEDPPLHPPTTDMPVPPAAWSLMGSMCGCLLPACANLAVLPDTKHVHHFLLTALLLLTNWGARLDMCKDPDACLPKRPTVDSPQFGRAKLNVKRRSI